VFYSDPGYDDPVTIELGVSTTPLLLDADPQVSTFTFKGFSYGSGTLLLDGLKLRVGQVITGDEFEALDFGPALITGLANFEFEISDGAATQLHRQWIDVSPALDATYTGSVRSDFLDGGAGNDRIASLAGDDVVLGGTGKDAVDGGSGIDRIQGGTGIDRLFGAAGADIIRGGADSDYINGGGGVDVLFGGAGNDCFIFAAPLSKGHRDVIVDFSNSGGDNDTFFLNHRYMPALGPDRHVLEDAFFREGRAALDVNDHIIYDSSNGALYYDANGNAAGGMALLATLTNRPHLTASDFLVT
jgi:Ca2+-binding RTX toxin-like protein